MAWFFPSKSIQSAQQNKIKLSFYQTLVHLIETSVLHLALVKYRIYQSRITVRMDLHVRGSGMHAFEIQNFSDPYLVPSWPHCKGTEFKVCSRRQILAAEMVGRVCTHRCKVGRREDSLRNLIMLDPLPG